MSACGSTPDSPVRENIATLLEPANRPKFEMRCVLEDDTKSNI